MHTRKIVIFLRTKFRTIIATEIPLEKNIVGMIYS